MIERPVAIIVMGVSGAGKTTIGRLLATELGCRFQEGDDLHPAANVEKMAAGRALTDADRWPWLERIAALISEWRAAGACGVISCSALKRGYRDFLRSAHADVAVVHLQGAPELLRQRLQTRRGHFMPATLLESQLQALQPPAAEEAAIVADVRPAPEVIVAGIIAQLAQMWPGVRVPAQRMV